MVCSVPQPIPHCNRISMLSLQVLLLNGSHKGCTGELLAVNVDKFNARVKILEGDYRGTVLEAVEYEDVCKFSM